jgi:serine/threonine-protein kinase RsbW
MRVSGSSNNHGHGERETTGSGVGGARRNGNSSRVKASGLNGGPLKFEIRSDYAEGREVQRRIMSDVERLGYDANSLFAIKLALEEAIINAIKHGNKLDPKKHVRVQAKVTPRQTEIVVEDEGPGFKRTSVPDPTADENLCKCSGRGILLMEAYMNRVQWTNGGRRVKLVKKNEK